MNKEESTTVANSIFYNIFGVQTNYTMEEITQKYAFDFKRPVCVKDSFTGQETWTDIPKYERYITQTNMEHCGNKRGWMFENKEFKSLQEIMEQWNKINYMTTERYFNSIDVHESDTIYDSNSVYRSTSCSKCNRIIFCDNCVSCELTVASQRSLGCVNCIRVDDSGNCSNSYNVICSKKIANSFFIQDCSDLYECMFCSHISNRRFCIANSQCSEKNYYAIKKVVIDWILKR